MTLFSMYEGKIIRLTDDQGNTFTGVADTFPAEYGMHAYYSSGEWRDDYEADERGELPPDLKRGVLSRDALYHLLSDR